MRVNDVAGYSICARRPGSTVGVIPISSEIAACTPA